MLDEASQHRRQMLNETLRRGVTANDILSLKRGEMLYLWEKDVGTVRVLSDYTGKSVNQIHHVCRREESILYKGKSKISTARRTVFGKLKFPVRYFIRIEEYPDFVEWREKNLDYVSMRAARRMLGKRTLKRLIKEGNIKLTTASIKGKEVTGVSRISLLKQLDMEISTLREYTEELTIYNDSDFDNSDAGGDVGIRPTGNAELKIQLSVPLGTRS
jgi:hypothetical protein